MEVHLDDTPRNQPFLGSDFPGDTLPSVAVLMEDVNQIWIYRNLGNGALVTLGDDPPPCIERWFREVVFSAEGTDAKSTTPPHPHHAPPKPFLAANLAAIAIAPTCHD